VLRERWRIAGPSAVLELLQELRHELSLSMLFITHNLGVVACLADSVLVMQDGRVRESGSVAAVLSTPTDSYTRALLDAAPSLVDITLRGTGGRA
jgi:peptide/nickel transport system ATP-binding protein